MARLLRALICLAVLVLGLRAADAQGGSRRWQAPERTAVPPVLDGALDDPCWVGALSIADFHPLGRTAQAPGEALPATRALLTWDAQALYIAFDCREPLAPALLTKVSDHDGPVWSDDSIEVFLDPAGTRQGFVQVAVNAAGVIMDGIQTGLPGGLDRSWETGATAACKRLTDAWTVELAIPLAGLPLAAPTGDWTFHVARNRRTAGQHLTALATAINGFGDVARFDVLTGIVLPERAVAVTAVDLGEGFQGTNLARVTVRNLAEREAPVTATLVWGDGHPATPLAQTQATVAPGAEAVLVLPWARAATAAAQPGTADALICRVAVGGLLLRQTERRLGPLPEAVGPVSPRVFLMEPHRPVGLHVPLQVGEGSRRGLVLEWQAFDGDGGLAGSGLTTVRTADAVVRLFWNRWNAGRYTVRFSLRHDATVLASADTSIRLVRSPWGE